MDMDVTNVFVFHESFRGPASPPFECIADACECMERVLRGFIVDVIQPMRREVDGEFVVSHHPSENRLVFRFSGEYLHALGSIPNDYAPAVAAYIHEANIVFDLIFAEGLRDGYTHTMQTAWLRFLSFIGPAA